jgi:hypothetical protein
MQLEIEIDSDDLRISFARGGGGHAVIAFTGVGHLLGGIQTEEFRRSLAQVAGRDMCSVIYVIDKHRYWYNNGLTDQIDFVLNRLLDRLGSVRCVTLGNSMGGYGAIIFARRLIGCGRAIAFCPQSSVSPAHAPFETRWPEWRGGINAWDVADAVTECRPDLSYHLFFGREDGIDMQHAARFGRAGQAGIVLHVIPDCGHDVAGFLKDHKRLAPLLMDLIWRE